MFMWKTAITGIVAGIVFGIGLLFILKSTNIKKFEEHKARLISAYVREEKRWRYGYSRYGYRRFKMSLYKVYIPDVKYIYTVGGRTYKGTRFSYPRYVYSSEGKAVEDMVKAGVLRRGERSFYFKSDGEREIKIFYERGNPLMSAVVVKPPKPNPYGWVLVFVAIFMLGLMWLFFMSERRRLEEWETDLRARLREFVEPDHRK